MHQQNHFHTIVSITLFSLMVVGSVLLVLSLGQLQSSLSNEQVLGHAADVLDNIRSANVYIRSTGTESLQIDSGTGISTWESQYLLKNPDGSLSSKNTSNPSDSAFTNNHSLSIPGDYHFVTTLPFRSLTLSSTAKMVVEPNMRKATYIGLNEGHAASTLYFYVPVGTSSFTFKSMMTAGDDNVANEAILYDETGTIHTTQALSIPVSGTYQTESITVNSPNTGYWSASINIESATNDSEGTFWVEGIPNIFGFSESELFEPSFIDSNLDVDIDLGTLVGTRGLIGAGRLYEPSDPPQPVEDAFLNIGLEANEVALSHSLREPVNDDADPNILTIGGYNFTFQGVDYTVNTLKAEPVITLTNAASWLVGGLSYTCNAGTDCNLQDSSVHSEWAEYALAVLVHYNTVEDYAVKYLRIVDEPNLDPIPASDFADLFDTAASKVKAHVDTRVNTVELFSGGVAIPDTIGKSYLSTLIMDITPSNHTYLGVHPWMLGYGGFGTLYTTPFITDLLNTYGTQADSQGGSTPKKFIFSEANATGPNILNQDSEYYSSFDHAIWWWSFLFNSINSGRMEATLYSPFEDDGSVDNLRGMVKSDGTYKPVAYATKFFLDNAHESVFSSSVSNSQEVESLVLGEAPNYSVILLNKADRFQNIDLNFNFAEEKDLTWSIDKISAAGFMNSSNLSSGTDEAVLGPWTLGTDLDPDTLVIVTLTIDTAVCSPDWSCAVWSTCDASNTESRNCNDLNSCGDNSNKPVEIRSCSCTPDWQCTGYSVCGGDRLQSRTCQDANSCGDESSKPAEVKVCELQCDSLWSCDEWSSCSVDGFQIRSCLDINACGDEETKPHTRRNCNALCVPDWKCEEWSTCSEDGTQTRSCTDLFTCDGDQVRPEESQSCVPESQQEELKIDPIPLIALALAVGGVIAGTLGYRNRSKIAGLFGPSKNKKEVIEMQ